MQNLKIANYDITFLEVPNEVTLCLNISGCRHHCIGCHSKYLWDDVGEDISLAFPHLMEKYSPFITCVCFMGGDHNLEQVLYYATLVKEKFQLKCAFYSGSDCYKDIQKVEKQMDYIKYGSYQADKGGLDNPNTNQKMIKIQHIENDKIEYIDITENFWKKDKIIDK